MSSSKGYRTISLPIGQKRNQKKYGDEVAVRASPKVAEALEEITDNASLYEGVRLTQVIEAAYVQGRKDGAREVFDRLDGALDGAKEDIPHIPPGRPAKKKRG